MGQVLIRELPGEQDGQVTKVRKLAERVTLLGSELRTGALSETYIESLGEAAERMRHIRAETAQLIEQLQHARPVSTDGRRASIYERTKRLGEYVKIAGDIGTKVAQVISKLREWFPHHPHDDRLAIL